MRLQLDHLPADVLPLSELARATLAGRPHPPELAGMFVPATTRGWARHETPLDDDDRAQLASALERELARFEPHVAVLESARALADENAMIVLAGQQPGFLGGPAYNVYKALHVVRLAAELQRVWGTPVVPGFWNHADDHDIAEVHHLWIQNPNLDLRKVGMASVSSGRVPFGRIIFDEERHRLASVAELLRQNLWEGDDLTRALELFVPRHGESLSNAFSRLLLGLFGHHGLLVIEPDWIRPSLSRALAHVVTCDVKAALEEGGARLGREPAIDPSSAALVFHLEDGRRQALRFAPGGFRYDDEPGSRTASELAAEIVQAPEAWSAAALLRPVAQDLCLPVAAYVGGWGELAYHAQLRVLRERAGAPNTPFVPRLSATIVDPEVDASLTKIALSVRDALAAAGHLGGDERAAPLDLPEVLVELRRIAAEASERLRGQREALGELDRGLAIQLKRTADQVRDLVEKLVLKGERVHANSQGKDRRHLRRLNNGLWPRGLPQERVRGALEFVARFGTDWLDELLAELDPLPTEHLVIRPKPR